MDLARIRNYFGLCMNYQHKCGCYFCQNGKDHPIHHEPLFEAISTVPRSEADVSKLIHLEACLMCGHTQVVTK